ncbi:MAG: hypothetical protein GY802_30335 [Gammaproteobacteria bacterium]|nr:hypothetical protein [Gammaproteobacteria bacterium]
MSNMRKSLGLLFPAMRRDIDKIRVLIRMVTKRNLAILSAGIRPVPGKSVYQSSDHARLWQDQRLRRTLAFSGRFE